MPSSTKEIARRVKLSMPRSIHSGKRTWQPLAQQDEMVTVDFQESDARTPKVQSTPIEEEADCDVGCLRAMMFSFYYRFNIGGYKTRRDIYKSKKVCSEMLAKVDVKITKTEDRISVLESMLRKQVKNKNRRQAKKYLQQMKRAQKSLSGFMAYKSELESMLISLDQTEDQTDFVVSFKAARKALNGHSKRLPIADFDDFVDDMEETKADLDDFHNTLAQRTDVQYADIEEELDAMFGEESNSGPPKNPNNSSFVPVEQSLPEAPTTSIYTPEQLFSVAEEQLKILEDVSV